VRNAILGLVLCSVTPAVCQYAPSPLGPVELGQIPRTLEQHFTDFSKLQWNEPLTALKLPQRVIVPRFEAPRRLPDNAQIDPKIIARPPQVSVGVQPAGKMVAKNEFPNLELLPIKSGKSTERPIPAQWPDFKL
jgi:hypothetical protein